LGETCGGALEGLQPGPIDNMLGEIEEDQPGIFWG